MAKTKVAVYTRPGCPHCPGAVKLAKELEKERNDIKVFEVSTATRGGQLRARQLGVTSVPTTFLKGPSYHEILALRGIPSKERFIEAIEVSQGIKEIELIEEKSFFENLKEKLGIKITKE